MRKTLLFALAKEFVRRSNASLLDLDCSSLTGWTANDTGEAVSDQTTFDSKSVFRFDTNTSADTGDGARRFRDVGSVEGLGNNIVVSLNTYFDKLGNRSDTDRFSLNIYRSDWIFQADFAADGLWIYNGSSWTEIGTNLVVEDIWQEWSFDIDLSGGVASATCDVYLNSVLQSSGVDCNYIASGVTDGLIYLILTGYATDNLIGYIDWLKIGDGFQ